MALDATWWASGYLGTRLYPDFSAATVTEAAVGNHRLQRVTGFTGGIYIGAGHYQGQGDVVHGTTLDGSVYGYGGGNYAAWESYQSLHVTPYVRNSLTNPDYSQPYLRFPFQLTATAVIDFYWNSTYVTPRTLFVWCPDAWAGTAPAVIGSILRCVGLSADHIHQGSFSHADDNVIAGVSVVYRREPGQSLADTICAIARHSWDLLTVTMDGSVALFPRSGIADYTISSLDKLDGVISVDMKVSAKYLANSAHAGYGRWIAAQAVLRGTDGITIYEYANITPVPTPSDWGGDGLWQDFSDAASIAKYGLRELTNMETRIFRDGAPETLSAYHLPYLTSLATSGTRYTNAELAVAEYMARLDADAQQRREIRVVQDMRGVDYDCGWRVEDVAVTNDGQTIPDMRCIRKVIDFRDMSVTSTLLEEPAV